MFGKSDRLMGWWRRAEQTALPSPASVSYACFVLEHRMHMALHDCQGRTCGFLTRKPLDSA